jgi:hypothetical protein
MAMSLSINSRVKSLFVRHARASNEKPRRPQGRSKVFVTPGFSRVWRLAEIQALIGGSSALFFSILRFVCQFLHNGFILSR